MDSKLQTPAQSSTTRRRWLTTLSGSLVASALPHAESVSPPTVSSPLRAGFNEQWEKDPRSSADIVAAWRAVAEQETHDASLAVVHYRGGSDEFDLGCLYAASADPLDRVTGADVLAQLGWGDSCFMEESLPILFLLLRDPDPRVVAAAAIALGHRNDPRAIPLLLPHVAHPDENVRYGVVHGLSRHEDESAIQGLIQLSIDEDIDVRNWATFGLASLCEIDTPALRDALADRLTDTHHETRGEALIGLASRRDSRVLQPLIAELSGKFHGSWCLEAAELLGNATLLPLLQSLRNRVCEKDRIAFKTDFEDALAACSQGDPAKRL